MADAEELGCCRAVSAGFVTGPDDDESLDNIQPTSSNRFVSVLLVQSLPGSSRVTRS